ncbi:MULTISPECIES: exo-alpha-sialidase [unclassified Crossiella]|uniref:WD40/YVTN/BNR-like repeat-containing protein n=1 Tax=unclassified Crossiella TaxID=2620835 RepID=UPI00200048EA|nr:MULTISPECIES: exo-alpha-sialidase [unclassified Crossiella]MCK2240106.1 exo-alpha-sialidase [Crossiella sp. S99.2]MCK2253442.1 exo-alpha-sialidase [Crossiella sp. S99.1]
MPDEQVLLAVGTRKGLWLATSEHDRADWTWSGPHHAMTEVYAVAVDTRRETPRLLAGVASEHFGPSVATSDDLGESWQEPDHAPVAFPADTGAELQRVWQLAAGPADQPEVVYAGTQPSALFRSTDGGRTYDMVRGLWDHPHREQWGAGYGGQAVHTILPHPTDRERVTVAMSTGGVYRTEDGGTNWTPSNTGIKAYFLPDPYPEYGQCVHKIAQNPADPDRMFLQNHHGVYRSEDGGAHWTSIADGLPSDFGFPIAVHPHRPEVVYGFPLTADSNRFPPEGACRVFRSEDSGAHWTALTKGLPQENFWTTVLRDALCVDDASVPGVYFGSRSGEVYASRDEGASWQRIIEHLPDVLSVRAAVIRR